MKFKAIVFVLCAALASWSQTSATPGTGTANPASSQKEAAKGCPCCEKMGDAKAEASCCHKTGAAAEHEKAMSCCSGGDGKSCMQGKDAKSSMKDDPNASASVSACCGGKGEDCCTKEKDEKTAMKCCSAGKCDRESHDHATSTGN